MAARPTDWRQLAAAEEALLDGGPGARTPDAMRRFLQLVRPATRRPYAARLARLGATQLLRDVAAGCARDDAVTDATAVARLAELEGSIALFKMWGYRGINDSENPARMEYKDAMEFLTDVRKATVPLTGGVLLNATDDTGEPTTGIFSEKSHYTPPDEWGEDFPR